MDGETVRAVGFTGRSAELRILADTLTAAEGGEGRVVVVSGGTGIGKTRFCREVATLARGTGFAVGWGTCWPNGGAPPLWPWQAILDSFGDAGCAHLLADDPGGATVEPERFARFTAVVTWLTAACAVAPALVVIDDIHLADAGALLLTRFIARNVARMPLVLLLVQRTDPADDSLCGVDSEATLVYLGGFDQTETAGFLRAHGCTVTDPNLLDVLHRLTGGHPLHLHRLAVDGCVTAGRHHGQGGVRTAVARAVTRLTEPTLSVLSRAAILGPTPLVTEAASVCAAPPSAIRSAVDEAVPTGLIVVEADRTDRFSYGHELVRDAFQARLGIEERLAAHAGAVKALSGARPQLPARVVRRAHHALQAASRSADDARTAIAAARTAARTLVAGFDYERACGLLARAAAVHEQVGLLVPVADLLVEWAEATLMCGRLAAARPLFERAARCADAERDAVSLARAAVGLGGVWVNEHRTHIEWERTVALQRRALTGLPTGETGLRQRLAARLAAEGRYRGGPIEPVFAAIEAARRLGDGKVLAEALSLGHHALLTPAHTGTRLPLAEELITVAAACGEDVLALLGLCWRTVDLFHLGDAGATRALADLRERADVLGCQSVLYIAEAMEVMLLIRAGRLAEAEDRAQSCHALGVEVGDADALGYLGAHLTTIRWLQGRDAEMLETVERIADSPTLNPAEFGFQATVACLAARAGQHERARTLLDRLTAPGLAELPESSTWLAAMLAVGEAVKALADAGQARQVHHLARQVYDLVKPYAELPVMPSLAVSCFGSAHRLLGNVALAFDDLDGGVAHLEQAVTANRLLGNQPVTAMTRVDLAGGYLRRCRTGDRERACALLAQAAADAATMGMTAHVTTWRQRLRDLTDRAGRIERHGRVWTLAVGGRSAAVSNRRGVRYLVQLLTNPGRPVTALELAGDQGGVSVVAGPQQPVLDERAKAAYRRRVRDLATAVERAEDRGDADLAGRLRVELDALIDEVRRVTGRGGRIRAFADPGERARTAVRHAIKRAIDEIDSAEPAIAALLRRTVSTGATCCYTVDDAHPVRWAVTETS